MASRTSSSSDKASTPTSGSNIGGGPGQGHDEDASMEFSSPVVRVGKSPTIATPVAETGVSNPAVDKIVESPGLATSMAGLAVERNVPLHHAPHASRVLRQPPLTIDTTRPRVEKSYRPMAKHATHEKQPAAHQETRSMRTDSEGEDLQSMTPISRRKNREVEKTVIKQYRQAEFKGTLLDTTGDCEAHLELCAAQLEGKGQSDSQKVIFILSSLATDFRSLLKNMSMKNGIPEKLTHASLLTEIRAMCSSKTERLQEVELSTTQFAHSLVDNQAEEGKVILEKITTHVGKVTAMLQAKCETGEITQGQMIAQLREAMTQLFHVLQHRSRYSILIEKKIPQWNKGMELPCPGIPFKDNEFRHLIFFCHLHEKVTKEKQVEKGKKRQLDHDGSSGSAGYKKTPKVNPTPQGDKQKPPCRRFNSPAGCQMPNCFFPHVRINPKEGSRINPNTKFCTHCKKKGHVDTDCFILHPEKKSQKKFKKE